MTGRELLSLVQRGESEQLEFKQSSAQFPRAGETLCAFMNGRGGQVLIGVGPDGSVVGQTIADKTFQELAQVLRRFDPPIPVETERIGLINSRGHGRGAVWFLAEEPKLELKPNKAE